MEIIATTIRYTIMVLSCFGALASETSVPMQKISVALKGDDLQFVYLGKESTITTIAARLDELSEQTGSSSQLSVSAVQNVPASALFRWMVPLLSVRIHPVVTFSITDIRGREIVAFNYDFNNVVAKEPDLPLLTVKGEMKVNGKTITTGEWLRSYGNKQGGLVAVRVEPAVNIGKLSELIIQGHLRKISIVIIL